MNNINSPLSLEAADSAAKHPPPFKASVRPASLRACPDGMGHPRVPSDVWSCFPASSTQGRTEDAALTRAREAGAPPRSETVCGGMCCAPLSQAPPFRHLPHTRGAQDHAATYLPSPAQTEIQCLPFTVTLLAASAMLTY